MDDQDQTSPTSADPSATQIQTKRQTRNSAKSKQPKSAAQSPAPSTSLAQPLKNEASLEATQPRPAARQSPEAAQKPNSSSTRQIPQPILFSEVLDVEEIQVQVPTRSRRLNRARLWRIGVPLLTFLLGLAIGLTSLLWYGLSATGPLVIVPPSAAQGDLIIEADKSFVTQLVRNDLSTAGLPGKVENVSVDLGRGAKMVIKGDDLYSVFGVNVSRHFTITVQPYVQHCVLQMRVLSADLGGISVTGFAQSFQGKINQDLAVKPSGLPGGFTYCTIGVRTEPGGMFITYRASAVTPTP
jgi:hypothetical protein